VSYTDGSARTLNKELFFNKAHRKVRFFYAPAGGTGGEIALFRGCRWWALSNDEKHQFG
jgi:hypothetical protein